MTLRCVSRYTNTARALSFVPGQEFEVAPDLGAYLLADAPGCFEEVHLAPAGKDLTTPPVDKAVKAPPRRK
jgi:hypothetical protein